MPQLTPPLNVLTLIDVNNRCKPRWRRTSNVESGRRSTGVAVAVSSGSDPPGSTSTQSVPQPVIVVYSQDVLKRYDGSSSPKEYMDHFDIIADV